MRRLEIIKVLTSFIRMTSVGLEVRNLFSGEKEEIATDKKD